MAEGTPLTADLAGATDEPPVAFMSPDLDWDLLDGPERELWGDGITLNSGSVRHGHRSEDTK